MTRVKVFIRNQLIAELLLDNPAHWVMDFLGGDVDGVQFLGLPLLTKATYLATPREGRWCFYLGLALAVERTKGLFQ